MGLMVEIGRSENSGGRTHKIGVDGWAKASAIVRAYIEEFHLGSDAPHKWDCFTGGKVFDGETQVGRISYNGHAWDMNDNPISL